MRFAQPFTLRVIDSALPAGVYTVDIDEELIDGLSFIAYRRTATWVHLPSIGVKTGYAQMILVDPSELESGVEALSKASA